jgi:hypothetical protein
MKKTVLLPVILSVLFAGCSREPNVGQPDELGKGWGLSPDGGMLGLDGVFLWDKETEISFTDYYSQIDTVISEKVIKREVKYYCSEDENVSVKWITNGYLSDTEEAKTWKGDLQKWLIRNIAAFNVDGISENLQIEATVQFTGTSVRRFKTIPKITFHREVSDVFGYTFGTPRTEMSVSRDISPRFSYPYYEIERKIHLFEFSNGELVRLYSFYDGLVYMGFNEAVNQCKIQEPIEFENFANILNPQEWTVGNLKMKVYNTTLEKILDTELGFPYDREIACLTIEKLLQ